MQQPHEISNSKETEAMQAQVKLGRVFGIAIGLHYSWLIIAALITFSLVAHFRIVNSNWGLGIIWVAAIITSLLFFIGLFAHELSHALVARSRHLPVSQITLFALGGVAQIEGEAKTPGTEFWMAIVGPITSWLLGVLLLGIAYGIGWVPNTFPVTPVQAVLVWLGYINISLAVFNMIPGFPLDGGRVLRAFLWWISGNADRSARIAARGGQLFGLMFIFYGIFRFFTGAGVGGLWLVFIGWFLHDAARASYWQYETVTLLKGLKAKDLMSNDYTRVNGNISLQEFVDHYLLITGQRCFVVTDGESMMGLITPREVRSIERIHWPVTPIRQIMLPLTKLHSVEPETPLDKAVELMAREDLNQVPVISDHHFEGMISRGNVLRVLQSRIEFQAKQSKAA